MTREHTPGPFGRHLFTIDDSAQQEREQCTTQVTRWLVSRRLCRTQEAARRLAERIISGDYDACADE